MKANFGICLILGFFHGALGWPGGAPKQACNDLIPQHGTEPQGVISPYHKFLIDKPIYQFGPGEKINFTLFSIPEAPEFKGFLVQVKFEARTALFRFAIFNFTMSVAHAALLFYTYMML